MTSRLSYSSSSQIYSFSFMFLYLYTCIPCLLIFLLLFFRTRVVQKLIDTLKTRQQISLVISALQPGFLDLIKDINGNHVVSRCLQCFDVEDNKVYSSLFMPLKFIIYMNCYDSLCFHVATYDLTQAMWLDFDVFFLLLHMTNFFTNFS